MLKAQLPDPAEYESSWDLREIRNEQNTLRIRITIKHGTIQQYSSKLSPIYTINDALSVQMRMCRGQSTSNFNFGSLTSSGQILLFLKLAKLRPDDNELYYADMTCNENYMHMTLITDDKIWRLVNYNALMAINFDITITVGLLSDQVKPFASLYDETQSTDLKLVGDDGFVELHSSALAAYSPVFKSILCEKAREPSRPFVVELPGVQKAILQHLKDYVYLHRVPNSFLEELLLFASKYNMTEFGQMCTEKLVTTVSAENIYELTKFAQNNDIIELYLYILQLVENDVIKVEDIRKCISSNVEPDKEIEGATK